MHLIEMYEAAPHTSYTMRTARTWCGLFYPMTDDAPVTFIPEVTTCSPCIAKKHGWSATIDARGMLSEFIRGFTGASADASAE